MKRMASTFIAIAAPKFWDKVPASRLPGACEEMASVWTPMTLPRMSGSVFVRRRMDPSVIVNEPANPKINMDTIDIGSHLKVEKGSQISPQSMNDKKRRRPFFLGSLAAKRILASVPPVRFIEVSHPRPDASRCSSLYAKMGIMVHTQGHINRFVIK